LGDKWTKDNKLREVIILLMDGKYVFRALFLAYSWALFPTPRPWEKANNPVQPNSP
jgi:hypothetical protein